MFNRSSPFLICKILALKSNSGKMIIDIIVFMSKQNFENKAVHFFWIDPEVAGLNNY